MSYNKHYAVALLRHGHALGSPYWSIAQRMDFIAMYRMGGEL